MLQRRTSIDAALNDADLIISRIDHEELAELTSKLNGEKDAGKITQIFKDEAQRLIGAGKATAGEVKSLV
ncbi:predicted protein [Plenodomus lingam JN3]|uniref:Predicted protein n=1 Tax=Leptosphaeria maculans (strain JN3 / isolate v23.1.3 / race Av1-4-5-6-7-8) TaxID=985895 RepID=E4ZIH2_LEPMJ|nr:predicted protein [Plenodomus lingam JN3]CBX90993.1 predicted protein [Plenodomus lingam JN3]